jgi:lysylphosphatidylglycerol synthetase-like protein (DUF2156 family)
VRRPARIPSAFRSLRLLRALNVAAMGLSLAAATGGVFSYGFEAFAFGVIAGLPTLLYGLAWAVILRIRATVGKSKLRWGWLASVPLAICNGALAGGLLMATEPGSDNALTKMFFGAIAGATFGAIFWVPGLLATLAFFGLPVARAQAHAEKGLAGEERGERIVGITSAVLAALGLATTFATTAGKFPPSPALEPLGLTVLYALSILGLVTGSVAAGLAYYRESRRKEFVSDVAAGKIRGFRLDEAAEGKVLVRVSTQGEGYRVADVEEELLALDEAGEALREVSPGRTRQLE